MSIHQTLEEVRKIFRAHLKIKNLRKTPERFAILEEIYTKQGHFDVEALYVSMKEKKYRVSKATVYNTLNLLMECDLVTKHQFGKSQAQFEKAFGFRQHDHLICTDCNKLYEFCDPRIQNIQSTVGHLFRVEVLHHSLILYGNCAKENCENKPSP